MGPCPACHEARAKGDRRPPVVLRSEDRWWCSLCKVAGDAYDLVGLRLLGRRAREAGAEFTRILDWLRDRGDVEKIEAKPPAPPVRPPRVGVLEALRRAVPLSATRDPDVLDFLARRRLGRGAPGGVLPPEFVSLPWWPAGWSRRWPLVVPAVDAQGAVRSLHARAVAPGAEPKTLWPKGVDAVGLVFADPRHARPWLQGAGRVCIPSHVLIVEGLTDYLRACTEAPGWAVIGIESGSTEALGGMPWAPTQRVYMAPDADGPGDDYARRIEEALPIAVRRAHLPPGADLCDALDAGACLADLLGTRVAA